MNDRKKIYHLLYGDIFFHVKSIITSIDSNSEFCHHYLLFFTSRKILEDYREFLPQHGIENYSLLYLGETPFHTIGGSRKDFRQRLVLIRQVLVLFKMLLPFRKQPLIVHGFFPMVLRLLTMLFFRNLSFVCWGSTWGAGFKRRLRLLTYSGINRMVFLQRSDMDQYISLIKGRESRCSVIPYLGNCQYDLPPSQEHIILLGNTGARWREYMDVLNILKNKNIPDTYTVCCMVAYGIDFASPEYKSLVKLASEMPFKVEFWDSIITKEEYVKKFNTADIIILGVEVQTALGAIYTGFSLGKKLFLNGTNLATFKEMGAVCFDFSRMAEMSDEDFFAPLSDSEKNNNAGIVKKLKSSGPEPECIHTI